jgi:hypothetical protein
MPTTTTDQGLSLPIGGDAANNPVAFSNFVSGTEPRLVRSYTDEADRTTKMVVLTENAISTLATENRAEIYNGSAHISLYTRSLYATVRKTANQNVGPSNTTLQNVTDIVVALPSGISGAIFGFRGVIWYDSATAADIKFAFTLPAGATMRWAPIGIASGATTQSFDGAFGATTGSGTGLILGGAGVGSDLMAIFHGELTMANTAGNLQLQAAQGTSDATATTVQSRTRLEVWRTA